MNRNCLASVVLVAALLAGLSGIGAAEEKTEVLYTSPNGAFRIEFSPAEGPGTEEATGDVWVVSAKDPTQRAKLPKQAVGSNFFAMSRRHESTLSRMKNGSFNN
jgi:hypothetical protein